MSTAYASFLSDIGGFIADRIPELLVIVAGLIGLGWAYSKFRKHVAGKKF